MLGIFSDLASSSLILVVSYSPLSVPLLLPSSPLFSFVRCLFAISNYSDSDSCNCLCLISMFTSMPSPARFSAADTHSSTSTSFSPFLPIFLSTFWDFVSIFGLFVCVSTPVFFRLVHSAFRLSAAVGNGGGVGWKGGNPHPVFFLWIFWNFVAICGNDTEKKGWFFVCLHVFIFFMFILSFVWFASSVLVASIPHLWRMCDAGNFLSCHCHENMQLFYFYCTRTGNTTDRVQSSL